MIKEIKMFYAYQGQFVVLENWDSDVIICSDKSIKKAYKKAKKHKIKYPIVFYVPAEEVILVTDHENRQRKADNEKWGNNLMNGIVLDEKIIAESKLEHFTTTEQKEFQESFSKSMNQYPPPGVKKEKDDNIILK